MIYENIKKATFKSRPNRFIANIDLDGEEKVCHVKNTGRCKELLVPGCEIYVQDCSGKGRKTDYDLIAVIKNGILINMDSMAPNKVFHEFVSSGKFTPDVTYIKPESKYKNSRFDFYIEAGERKMYVEVKGVTLEDNGVVSFPDAPTERGVKHIHELCDCVLDGFEAHVVFVVQMSGVKYMRPNWDTHPEFGTALVEAEKRGVKLHAYQCFVSPNELRITVPVIIDLAN